MPSWGRQTYVDSAAVITIVDYGMGNLGSIVNMLKKVGHASQVASQIDQIEAADKLILPGVGAFDSGMRNLADLGFVDILNRKVADEGAPVLGICLGMQLMTRSSEEGELPGLGWIDARTCRFPNDVDGLKVPHMGWNLVNSAKQSNLLADQFEEPRFYFVHSYYVTCAQPEDVLLTAHYGVDFHAGFQHENIMGVQFHPEKSHKFGMRLLKNFAEL